MTGASSKAVATSLTLRKTCRRSIGIDGYPSRFTHPSHHMLSDEGAFGKSRMALSESEIATETVVVPGELSLSNPVPPPITMPLPIVAWPNEVKNGWLGILFLLNGMMFLPLVVVIPEFFVHTVSGADNFLLSPQGGFIFLILLFIFP